jgi:rsbT co-antagonist protein RsbR
VEDNELAARAAMLEARVAELTAQLAQQAQIHHSVIEERNLLRAAFEAMPVGVVVADTTGHVFTCNTAMKSIMGGSAEYLDAPMPCEVFLPDGVTKAPPERDPIRRALHGHPVSDMESLVRPHESPERTTWINQSSQSILNEDGSVRACVLVTRDITEHKELVRELDEVVAATVEEKRVLIEKLEAGVKELSTPIIEVWDDVLALPVIGTVDAQRGTEMMSRLLDEVVSRGVQCVIVDWTGVDTMDSQSAQHLLDLVRSVELVGAECILTGIRPAVATALLDLDVRFEHLRLLRNVKFGLRHCLGRLQHSGPKPKAKAARPS